MNKVTALIAVRSGSVRVKNKNIKDFAGSNLLELKIKQLKEVKNIDEIVVSSDDEKMLEIADGLGVTALKRDPYYASSTVSMSDVYKYMAENLETEYVVYANVTNPLINTETYENAIKTFLDKKGEIDSLASCNDVKEFMWKNGVPLNYDPLNQPRSQDLPEIVALNFAISILAKEDMINYKNIIGKKPYFYKLGEVEAVDIDTPLDFFIAEELYKKTILNKEKLF